MTWRDLDAIGASTTWPQGELVFEAPEHVHGIIRTAIYERVSLVTDPALSDRPRPADHVCESCGDAQPTKRLGWCCLCAAAWQVAVRDRFARVMGESAETFRARWLERRALPEPALPPVPVWSTPLPPPPAWPSRAA